MSYEKQFYEHEPSPDNDQEDLKRLKRWAAKKLAICEEIEFEDPNDKAHNRGYMHALGDMIMEIEMRE